MLNPRNPISRVSMLRILFAIPVLMMPLALGCSSGGWTGMAPGGAGSLAVQELDELGQKLFAAIPEKAVVRPREARKILVFSRCEGYQHGAIPATAQLLELMGQKTGAFKVVHSKEMEVFEADFLAQFDLVFLNNTTHLIFESQEYRRNLLEFVRSGKGIAGFHAAIDNFFTWPEAAEMMGGQFEDHPWTANGTWAVKIDEPGHPLNASFGGRAFLIRDEIYQVMGPYSRDIDRVLLSLDMSNLRNHQVTGIKRVDNDFPISWVRRYGEGRVFYCSLGHNIEVLLNSAVVGHYLAGIQYALGDLEIDDTPSGSLAVTPRPVLTTEAGAVDDPFAVLVSYEDGQSRLSLAAIEAEIRNSAPAEHRGIETRLIDVLENPGSTFTARQFSCRMLRRIEPEQSLPYLSQLLRNEELSDAARFALQGVESPEVDRIFLEALDELEGDLRIGVIGSIGQRRSKEAVPRIAALLDDADPALAGACITAMGEIGGSDAAAALERAKPTTGLESLRQDALLRCADDYLDMGAIPEAQAIYNRMISEEVPVSTRIAAYRGMAHSQGDEAVQTLLAMLRDDEAKIQQAAARFMVELHGVIDIAPVAEHLATLHPATRIMVLSSLAYSKTRAAAPAVLRESESDDPGVRTAATIALGAVGDASHVRLLARIASSVDETAGVAAQSLARLDAEGVDDRIIQLIRESDDKVQAVLIGILAARNVEAAVPVYLEFAGDADSHVRAESIRALALLAGDVDLPALLDLLERAPGGEDRIELEKAILAVCERMEERDAGIDHLLTALPGKPSNVRASILTVLGDLPGVKSMAALSTATGDDDAGIRRVAIGALSNWPDAAPLETLLDITRSNQNEAERSLA
ncbi:MAG: ThuA domain-containing protein, partial [Candidatus Latescibacteria bacterium]|nr:ThuA domain-containing protein [Candidatus Latescibacterota bacterium]